MSGAHVFIDRSQFPEAVRRDLIESLRRREINHKFHYESYKQAAKWLALHEAYSPARTDPSCQRIYDEAFSAVTRKMKSRRVHVIGLGCGGGQKEARLLELLSSDSAENAATMVDVSLPLVLTARGAVLNWTAVCQPVVCDLGNVRGVDQIIGAADSNWPRVVTLFGMLPNSEPTPLLSNIAPLLRPDDLLLISANLAPGQDYRAGVEQVAPQYDNALTRDWLRTLLLDLGFENSDGELVFSIDTDPEGLHRITARFHLRHGREIVVSGERIRFAAGERIRVFFSYRHTDKTVHNLLSKHGLEPQGGWLNDSREEGVFLCRRAPSALRASA